MFLRRLLLIALLALFSIAVCGYGIYKALPIILGPKIEINYPNNGEVTDSTTIEVRGNVYRTKTLYINSIPTGFTEDGFFITRLAVFPGSNIIIIEATDRFGRKTVLTRNVGKN